jgi:lysophospholipase L1-like esterase
MFLMLSACAREPQLPQLADDAVILAFGDSLTYGTGAERDESYPEVLGTLTGRQVIQSGVPGEVTAEGLNRLPAVLDRAHPDLLILCHGGNDLLRRFDQQATKQNLAAMVRLARDRGIAVVLIAVPAPGIFLKPPALYQEVADEQKIPLENDILEEILSDGNLKSDFIHPNVVGYRQMAEAIRDLLRKSGAID